MAFIQQVSATGTSPQTLNLTGVTAGSTIVVFLWDGATSAPATRTVSDGTSYTAGATASDAVNNVWLGIFTLQNAGSGTHAIVGTTVGTDVTFMMAVELSAPSSGAVLDTNAVFQNAPGAGADALTTGALTIGSSCTLVGMASDTSNVAAVDEPTVGTGFASQAANFNSVMGSWRLETGPFSSNHAATFGAPASASRFIAGGAAIQEASAGSPPVNLMGRQVYAL